MSPFVQLFLGDQPAEPSVQQAIGALEVEENLDMPSAFSLSFPVNTSDAGDLSFINDPRLQPFSTLAVVTAAEDQRPECIFDGLVLSQKLHLERGSVNSDVVVWGQDFSWKMNLEEKSREWVDLSDGTTANQIFSEYGIAPSPDNQANDSPMHSETAQSLMQRGTDIQFLRRLARRTGKLVRVCCGDAPGARVGYFARPNLTAPPAAILILNDLEKWNVASLDLEWDVARPNAVVASQKLYTDTSEGVQSDLTASPLGLLGERPLESFAGQVAKTRLSTVVSDGGDLKLRAEAVLIDSGWFVHVRGETEVSRLKKILRAGQIVEIANIGSLHSGKYLVWSVRHSISIEAHRMSFHLVRNALGPLGPAAAFSGGLL